MSPTLTTPVTTPTSDDLFGGWCRPRHAQEAVVEAMTRRYIRGLGVVDDRDVMRIAETVAERCDGLDGAALRERVARVLAETCLGRVTGPAAGPELRTARRIDARQVEAVPDEGRPPAAPRAAPPGRRWLTGRPATRTQRTNRRPKPPPASPDPPTRRSRVTA